MKPSNKENKLLSEKLKKETELMEKFAVIVVKLFTFALTISNIFLALGSFCACALIIESKTIASENNFFIKCFLYCVFAAKIGIRVFLKTSLIRCLF